NLTCDGQVQAVCGNGIREGAEQCDDGSNHWCYPVICSYCNDKCTNSVTRTLIYGAECDTCNKSQDILVNWSNSSSIYQINIPAVGVKTAVLKYSNTDADNSRFIDYFNNLPPLGTTYNINVYLKNNSSGIENKITSLSLPALYGTATPQTSSINLGNLSVGSYTLRFDWLNDIFCPPPDDPEWGFMRSPWCPSGPYYYDVNFVIHSIKIQ
ncbi:hypothetical protein HZA71_02445, partial [Candidatus Falkowbacteria bacterium]|nr:hypothetical protein [Candidatus Falkowbacteria bacterium]